VDEFTAACRPLAELLDSVRKVEGFPVGSNEDILELSDPPYYTACPNPYLNDFIARYGRPYDEATDSYKRTPFVGDISEGKNDPLYQVHSYHTKVPYKAIMPFIKHYTEPGDIVFDGFCGTGMTGFAAQALGRRAILSDLSIAASFISRCYNTPIVNQQFQTVANNVLTKLENECSWMYETTHMDGVTKGKIHFVVWSDVFICPFCEHEYIFWDVAIDKDKGQVLDAYSCPNCAAVIGKKDCNRVFTKKNDNSIVHEAVEAVQVPVLINYSVNNKRFTKKPDQQDLDLIKKLMKAAFHTGIQQILCLVGIILNNRVDHTELPIFINFIRKGIFGL